VLLVFGEKFAGRLWRSGQAALLGDDCGWSFFDGAAIRSIGVELIEVCADRFLVAGAHWLALCASSVRWMVFFLIQTSRSSQL
jgi:hypothetical protein